MSKASASELREAIQKQANPKVASGQQRYFKTGPGEYGEGDKFLGLNVPTQRKIANEFIDISLNELQGIVSDEYHEIRSIGMIILTEKIQSTKSQIEKDKIFNFYIANKQFCNNWDLVDVSCTKIFDGRIVGNDLLNDLSKSESLWDRRISIVSTLSEIRKGNYEPTLRIASVLLQDSQDLIHKAVGWMLRE
ncbi:MAG: putative DNA alkylation repair protein, partial [Streblomastix strix]